MKRTLTIAALLALALPAMAQKIEKVKFGDFENWAVRYIKESGIIGGETKIIYAIAPNETIRENKPFDYSKTIWATSNSYAVVSKITNASCTVMPDKGVDGQCAKMKNSIVNCKALGIININVLAAGSIYLGKMHEPITSTENPMAMMDWGIPFTKKPSALILDYKAYIPNTGKIVKASGSKIQTLDGYDAGEVIVLLQNRWEDAAGNIHAKRIGTAIFSINKSTSDWVCKKRIPIKYGDAGNFKPFNFYYTNSKGKTVPIQEEGYGDAKATVTHMILNISSGSCEAYTGALDNTLWVDNVCLEYE